MFLSIYFAKIQLQRLCKSRAKLPSLLELFCRDAAYLMKR